MSVAQWNPRYEVEAMNRRLWRSMLDMLETSPSPAADMYETADEFVLEVEAPGFSEKEITIELSDHLLSVTGERKLDEKRDGKSVRHRHERLERAFARQFELPTGADIARISARIDNGLVEVHAPKLHTARPKSIAIKPG
jgi:HSP20 family protein